MTVKHVGDFLPNLHTLFLVKAVDALKHKNEHLLLFVDSHFKRVLELLYRPLLEKERQIVVLLH